MQQTAAVGQGAAIRTPVGRAAAADPRVQPTFEVRDVSHSFFSAEQDRFVHALRNLTLDIPAGRFVSLIGPSGCGKSTLLNMFAGLVRPTRGEVIFEGQPVPTPNTNTGYVTQSDTLLPWRRVDGNVAVGLEIKRVGRAERTARVHRALELVGLVDFAHAYPNELSGGMRKRVGLARVLAYEPAVFLMDEPFAALDAQLRVGMQDELVTVWERVGGTVVFVTHDIEEAVGLSDVVHVLHPRPGRLAASVPIDLPRPRRLDELRYTTEFVAHCREVRELLREAKPEDHGE